ncbi:uncharacterized protein RAG0_10196 [Rhynchosporium agropyri]|uniref:Uncharacterized protein n=1 Tax=Rhynchosporium agropyri TaxID=914238 RepID=A0A1E1KYV1_9HELO|nr:uncharacterized protein RAG0_10196 [Rhynchosporium agropyri]
MSVEIQHGSPMDITHILNPVPIPSTTAPPAYREDSGFFDIKDNFSPNIPYQYSSAPQPMEIDGELPSYTPTYTWGRYESSGQVLPPMQLVADGSHPRICQTFQSRGHSNPVTRDPRSNFNSPPRRYDSRDRQGCFSQLGNTLRRLTISLSLSSSYENSSWEEKKNRKSTLPRSNKAYSQEQVHWLRYHFIDCELSYKQMHDLWIVQFPDNYRDLRKGNQAFSSRIYRDNNFAVIDDFDNLIRGKDGKPKMIPVNMRLRKVPEYKDYPFTLWEKYPEWALYWNWVSTEHKKLAQTIVDGKNLDASQLRKERSRRANRIYEAQATPRKGWFATPALHDAAALKMALDNATTGLGISA